MIALVTGGNKGLGQALVQTLSEQGYTVVAHSHAQTDLLDDAAVSKLFKTIADQHGRLDVLINTVGVFGDYHPITEVSLAEWDNVVGTNLRATFSCIQTALPLFRKTGGGKIINFACATADQVIARKFTTPYYIAKSGVIALTKSYAPLLAPEHIMINTISPGVLENSAVQTALPMQRPASFTDITATVQWLLSDAANYISGANIEISGGWVPHQ